MFKVILRKGDDADIAYVTDSDIYDFISKNDVIACLPLPKPSFNCNCDMDNTNYIPIHDRGCPKAKQYD